MVKDEELSKKRRRRKRIVSTSERIRRHFVATPTSVILRFTYGEYRRYLPPTVTFLSAVETKGAFVSTPSVSICLHSIEHVRMRESNAGRRHSAFWRVQRVHWRQSCYISPLMVPARARRFDVPARSRVLFSLTLSADSQSRRQCNIRWSALREVVFRRRVVNCKADPGGTVIPVGRCSKRREATLPLKRYNMRGEHKS